jgi:hypothetical protein
LNQVEKRCDEREEECGVGGEEEHDVEENPAAVDEGEGGGLLAGMEGRDEAEEEADGKEEDAEGDGFVAPIDDEKRRGEEEAEEGLGLVGVDGEGVVGGVEHLGERDEVEEDGGDGGGDGDVTPARPVVQGGGQDRERGYAVEEDRDSEPKQGHRIGLPVFLMRRPGRWPQTVSISFVWPEVRCLKRMDAIRGWLDYAARVTLARTVLRPLVVGMALLSFLPPHAGAQDDPDPLTLLRPPFEKLARAALGKTRFTYIDQAHTQTFTQKGKKLSDTSQIYEVTYIGGLQYSKLLALDGFLLKGKELAEEQKRYDDAVRQRSALDDAERARILHIEMSRYNVSVTLSGLKTQYHNVIAGRALLPFCDCIMIDSTPLPGAPQRNYRMWIDPAKGQMLRMNTTLLEDEGKDLKGGVISLMWTYIGDMPLVSHSHYDLDVLNDGKKVHVIVDHTYTKFRRFTVTTTIVPVAPVSKK